MVLDQEPIAELAHPDDEVRALVEGIHARYGLDFRDYALASLKRRIASRLAPEGVQTIRELHAKVLGDPSIMERLLLALTIHVTAMFRDPGMFAAIREHVVPSLRDEPFVRIWIAGCSTGEEVYSLAIVLEEEGLYERCLIYATDVSEAALDRAKAGVFPLRCMREYTSNYLRAGGRDDFSAYYTADDRFAAFRATLRRNVVFAQHNLVTDASFNEFQLIFCRNVMIYFNGELESRVQRLLHQSLAQDGFLVLGNSESLRFSPVGDRFDPVVPREKLFRKVLA